MLLNQNKKAIRSANYTEINVDFVRTLWRPVSISDRLLCPMLCIKIGEENFAEKTLSFIDSLSTSPSSQRSSSDLPLWILWCYHKVLLNYTKKFFTFSAK
jgi:hypothetical protein